MKQSENNSTARRIVLAAAVLSSFAAAETYVDAPT